MGAVSWVMYVALGGLCMWAMRWTANKALDGVLVRVAAILFVGAGLVGAHGWIGSALTWVTAAITNVAGLMGHAVVGASLVAILALVLSVMWVAAMIPGKQFKWDAPDWLIIGGLILPSLMASIPGPMGEGLRTVVTTGGQLATGIVSGLVA